MQMFPLLKTINFVLVGKLEGNKIASRFQLKNGQYFFFYSKKRSNILSKASFFLPYHLPLPLPFYNFASSLSIVNYIHTIFLKWLDWM